MLILQFRDLLRQSWKSTLGQSWKRMSARRFPRIRCLPREVRHSREPLEDCCLLSEDCCLLSTVSWAVDASGTWNVGANWSSGAVSAAGDDVVIDSAAGDFTITFGFGATSVRSL